MTDSRTTKNKFQQLISNPAFDTSGMVKTATAPIQDSMTKSIANIMKPSLATLNAATSKPLQDILKQQETISRMFHSPETPSIKNT